MVSEGDWRLALLVQSLAPGNRFGVRLTITDNI